MQVLSAYLKFMTDIGALLAGARVNRTVIEQRMREVIAFEQAIAEVQCILCSLYQRACSRTRGVARNLFLGV